MPGRFPRLGHIAILQVRCAEQDLTYPDKLLRVSQTPMYLCPMCTGPMCVEQGLTNASKVANGLHRMFPQTGLPVAYSVQDLSQLLQDVPARPGAQLRQAGCAAMHKVLEQ